MASAQVINGHMGDNALMPPPKTVVSRKRKNTAPKAKAAATKNNVTDGIQIKVEKEKPKRPPNRWMLHLAKFREENAARLQGVSSIEVTRMARETYTPKQKCPTCGH